MAVAELYFRCGYLIKLGISLAKLELVMLIGLVTKTEF
jgi:hypothetical protein